MGKAPPAHRLSSTLVGVLILVQIVPSQITIVIYRRMGGGLIVSLAQGVHSNRLFHEINNRNTSGE